ncbi:MAG TPA: hypothetical protein VGF12_07250 [Roseateles sp.]|uniref:hypothetical protein n=1 Tax=Roseateles sp. TaxID=1971397 RepID=UPI002ED99761
MDTNICVEKSTLREAVRAAAENMTHDEAVAHVAELHLVPAESVQEALRTEQA